MDIKNIYLNTPFKWYEYLHLKLADIPQNVAEKYTLEAKVTKHGWVYVEIQKGMYGLPHAGLLVQELLEQWLANNRYHQSKLTPRLWSHETRHIQFCLVIDNFGIKYVSRDTVEHL